MVLGNQIVCATSRTTPDGESYQVSRVRLKKKSYNPPCSGRLVQVSLSKCFNNDFLFEGSNGEGVEMPPVIISPSDDKNSFTVELRNHSPRYVTFQPRHDLGCAVEIELIYEQEHSDYTNVTPQLHKVSVETLTADVPHHLKDLFERSIPKLSNGEANQLASLLIEYSDVFAESDTDLGCFTGIKHKIDTGDAKPIWQPMRRTPIGFEEEEKKHLDMESKIIQLSISDWAAPPVLVRKKDGEVRWCIDYSALNNVTAKDAFPLPRIEECLDTLAKATYMNTLDLASGYWQLEVAEEDCHKAAFITSHGLFEHIRMGFGWCNAPATFSRAMQSVLHGLLWGDVLASISMM